MAADITTAMFSRTRGTPPAGFIAPCLPSRAERPPAGPRWIHEIKHDGFRMMVRRDGAGVRLLTRNGYDWADRYPLIAAAAGALGVRSCLIDGEAVAYDADGMPSFNRLRYRRADGVLVRVRPARAQRPESPPRADRGAQTRARQAAALDCSDWSPAQRAYRRTG
jgi:ATP-dependent DNA ligase